MWLEIVAVLAIVIAFLLGTWMGTRSSSSTMSAAKLLWESAQSSLQDRSQTLLLQEELRRSLSRLEESSSAMEKATDLASSRSEKLTAVVDSLDQRSGMVFEALNGGVVLRRGQLQEQVSMGTEVRRAEAFRVSRGLSESAPD